jgi:hypothetical protein
MTPAHTNAKAAKIDAREDRRKLALGEFIRLTPDKFKTVANLSFPFADYVRYSTVFDDTVTSVGIQDGLLGIGSKTSSEIDDKAVPYQEPSSLLANPLNAVITPESNQVETLEVSALPSALDLV